MPSITVTALINSAVHWTPAPNTGGYPDAGPFDAPVEIACRWIDAEFNRTEANRSYMYVDRDMDSGGFLLKGTLDDLIPGNMVEYPNESKGLGEWAGHWRFDESLESFEEGPDFSVVTGSIAYGEGARDEAITNDGTVEFLNQIGTVSPVDLSDAVAWTLSFWLKLESPPSPSAFPSESASGAASPSVSPSEAASASPSPSNAFLSLDIGGLRIEIDGGSLFVDGDLYSDSLYDREWNNIQVINSSGSVSVIVDDETIDGNANPVPVQDSSITAEWYNDSGEIFWLDEMLLYPFAATATQSQSLAGKSPLDYDNAKSIIRTQFASSINGKLRVRKVMLEGRPE